ncbi:MAG: glycosyltransferase family 39 protein [Caldilineaceae bacterium SB0665_bin_25]|nr:glycosyltransferase family 39 protein [Caldilineaceae bacterium SB0665_bin_25]
MTEREPGASFEQGRSATASPQGAAAAAVSEKAAHQSILLVTGGILLALTLAVAVLRLQRITEFPQGIQSDEGPDGVYALQVLEGEHAVFFPEAASGREWMGVYTIALTTSFLGRTLLAFRLPTALAGAGTVFVLFWLGRLLFGRDETGRETPWRGVFIGGAGAGLLAVSLGQTIIGRASLRANYLPLFLGLCFALLWWGWSKTGQERSWRRIALAGVCAGLLPYTYIPSRFTPFLFLLFGLSFLWPLRDVTRKRLKAELPWAAIFIGAAGLVAAPILIYFALHPEHFFIRSREVWVLNESQGTALGAFLYNVWEHLLAFGFQGDLRERYNFAGRPMLNPWEAFFFWLGVGMALWRWQRQPAYRLLLLWLAVLLVPAMLARDVGLGPNTLRMIGTAPAVYLLIGAGMWETYRLLKDRWGRPRIFGEDWTRVSIALGVVVCVVVLLQGVNTYRTYFQKWAVTSEFYLAYHGEWADAAQVLNAQPAAENMVYLLPYRFDEHYGFEYLYHGDAPARVVRAVRPDLARKVESLLAEMDEVSAVKVLDWNEEFVWAGLGDENLIALLGRFGRYAGSEKFTNFRLHTYTDLELDRSWTFYETLEPLTVRYDGGIDLVGLALGRGAEQISSQQPLRLGKDRSLWVALQWQTTPGLDTDYAVSLRLYDSEGAMSYQDDHVLGNSAFARTRRWAVGEPVDTLFHLDFGADLRPGDYELRLIVYGTETNVPTVEIGVWEPELLLAHVRLDEGR